MANVSSSNNQEVRVPKLRFRDEDGYNYPQYQAETVGTLFNHISRRNTAMKNSNVITNSAEFGLISQRDFFDKDIAVEGNTDKYYIIERGDFVYNPRKSTSAPYGPFNCYQYPEEGIVSPLYTCLKPLCNEYTDYLLWYFRSPSWHSYIYHNGAQGGARHDRVGMTNDLMDGIPVNLPCLDEQKKVSRFLTTLEQRIEKQRQLVEALKSYKRGVSEAFFGNKIDLTTFPYNQWEKCKLGSLGYFYNGLSGKRKEDFGNGTSQYITYMNIYKNLIADAHLLECVNVSSEEKQNSVKYGDVLFTQSSETLEEIGYTSVWISSSTPYLNSFCFGFRFYEGVQIDPYFIAHYFRSSAIRKSIMREGQGATRVNLSSERLKEMVISLPPIHVQKKIGEILDNLEQQIRYNSLIEDQLNFHKSRLLQQLFI